MRISPSLKALVVAALLVCCAAVVFALFHEADMAAQISEAQVKLEAVQGRLRKQELEYQQALEALPTVQAELAETAPKAQAAYEQEQLLRQQRKDLRAEKKALEAELAELLLASDEAGEDAQRTAEAIQRLQNALELLKMIP